MAGLPPAKGIEAEIEEDWADRCAKLRCVLCVALLGYDSQLGKTDVHHARTGQGGAERGPDMVIAALCHDRCHQGPRGIHGDKSLLKQAKVDELDLVALTARAILRSMRLER